MRMYGCSVDFIVPQTQLSLWGSLRRIEHIIVHDAELRNSHSILFVLGLRFCIYIYFMCFLLDRNVLFTWYCYLSFGRVCVNSYTKSFAITLCIGICIFPIGLESAFLLTIRVRPASFCRMFSWRWQLLRATSSHGIITRFRRKLK